MTTPLERYLGMVPPSNPELVGLPFVALQSANDSKTDPGDVHAVAVLLRIGSVADGLAGVGVDVARAREGIARTIAALPARAGLGARFLGIFRKQLVALDPLQHPRALARAAGLKELTAPFALACFVAQPSMSDALRALEDAGFSLPRWRWHVAHRAAAEGPIPESGPVRVTLHDDPFTPMDFVTEVLEQAFGRDKATAETLMRRVHEEGSAALATMDAAAAARAVTETRSRAKAAGFPLRVEAQPA
jgi:ATP-dependent Clp protease adaptor protein ClpS